MKIKKLSMLIALAGAVSSVNSQDLINVYELALLNDTELREARSQRDAARQSKPQALSQLLPTVDFSAEASRFRDERSSGREYGDDNQFGLDLTQPVYNREFWVQFRQADNTVAQAEAAYAAAELDLIVRTTRAYFDVLSAQDTLRFTKANREATGRQLDQAKQRFDVGLIAITDVHEAQAAFDRARANEIVAENQQDNAWEALRVIIGPTTEPLDILGDKMPLNTPDPLDINQWSTVASSQNYNIKVAENAAEVARQEIEIQRSGHFPTLDLVGSYADYDSDRFSDLDESSSIGLRFRLPIYAGGGVVSRTDQARSEFQAAQEVLDRTRRQVDQQVRDAYRGVLASVSQVQALKATTVSAKSALESTEAGFEVGTRTIIDVLNLQQEFFRSQRDHLRSRYDYIINGLLLKQAASNLAREDLEKINTWLE